MKEYTEKDLIDFGEWILIQKLMQASFTMKELKEGISAEVVDSFLTIHDLFKMWRGLKK